MAHKLAAGIEFSSSQTLTQQITELKPKAMNSRISSRVSGFQIYAVDANTYLALPAHLDPSDGRPND
jgi:hypothetical protein